MNTIYRSNIYSEFLLILLILGSTLLNTLYPVLGWVPPRWLRSLLMYLLLFGLPSLLFMRHWGITWQEAGLCRLHSPSHSSFMTWAAAIALAMVLQAPLMLLSSLSELLFHNHIADTMPSLLEQPLLLSIFSTAICPAIFEELACRGIFLSGYRRVRPLTAAVICGIFFGILHLNMQQWVYAFAFGFVISLLQLGTGSLWLPMLVHCIINTVQILSAYTGISLFPNMLSMILAAVISLPLIILLLRFLGISLRKPSHCNNTGDHTEPLTWNTMKPFVYTIGIFVAALLLS